MCPLAAGSLLLAAGLIPAALLWDFSWESTVGIDLPWAAPHVTLYLATALAALGGFLALRGHEGTAIGRFRAPLGAWISLWGAVAFLTATLFDFWWQSGYGLAVGVWHPPQILKAIAFWSVGFGALFCCLRRPILFPLAGGMLLALASVMTLTASYANRQHGAGFYQLACLVYPPVLIALAVAGPWKFSATAGALFALTLGALAVWVLPLVPGSPQVPPIYHPRDYLLPPPFPLLLAGPALVLDLLLRVFPAGGKGVHLLRSSAECGLAFFATFLATQWNFASFLLSPAADNWFFAGGGRHWPFFLRIDAAAQTGFWRLPGDDVTLASGIWCAALALLSAGLGLALGSWLRRLQR